MSITFLAGYKLKIVSELNRNIPVLRRTVIVKDEHLYCIQHLGFDIVTPVPPFLPSLPIRGLAFT